MTKPFAWKCAGCGERQVYPATICYETTIDHDGRVYDVRVPDLEVPRCRNCGKVVMVDAANKQISDGLRRAVGLLSAAQIRQNREALGLTQKQLAAYLQVADATLSRWETGAQLQQRSLDRFLRIFFALPEVRETLANERQVAQLGQVPVVAQPLATPV